jgi:hypothetical protein
MATFALRGINDPLWQRVTARARADGWPLRALLLRLLDDYAAGRITPSGAPPPPAQSDTESAEG